MDELDDDHHDALLERVFRLTWERIIADTARFAGISLNAASWQQPQRFASALAHAETRGLIERACHEADADSQFAEFFTGEWLQQFAPRPL